MDDFKELIEAKKLIEAFLKASGSVNGDASGVLIAVRRKIDDYIQKNRPTAM